MSFLYSGSFHHLKSCLVIRANSSFFRFHPAQPFLLDRCIKIRTLTTKIEVRHDRPRTGEPPRSINLNIKRTQILTPQQQIGKSVPWSDTKINRPATILVFDIETTGFNRRNDRIIEFAVRDLMGGKNSTFQSLINPEKVVLNARIHGIHNYMVTRPQVPRFEEFAPILLQFVRSRQMEGKPVVWVAHNGRKFDVPFLTQEFERCSVEIPADWLFIDTLPLARQLVNPDGSKLGSFSLKSLREHYGITLDGPAHRAMADVTVLCKVFQRLTFDLKLTVPVLIEGSSFTASDINSKASP